MLYQKGGKPQKSPWGQTTMGGPEKVPGSGRLGWNLELSNAAQGIWLEKRRLDNCLERSAAWEEKTLILRLQQADVDQGEGPQLQAREVTLMVSAAPSGMACSSAGWGALCQGLSWGMGVQVGSLPWCGQVAEGRMVGGCCRWPPQFLRTQTFHGPMMQVEIV